MSSDTWVLKPQSLMSNFQSVNSLSEMSPSWLTSPFPNQNDKKPGYKKFSFCVYFVLQTEFTTNIVKDLLNSNLNVNVAQNRFVRVANLPHLRTRSINNFLKSNCFYNSWSWNKKSNMRIISSHAVVAGISVQAIETWLCRKPGDREQRPSSLSWWLQVLFSSLLPLPR